jgi:hypothetical protein
MKEAISSQNLKKNHHILSPFRENNKVVVFLFPFLIFMPLTTLWLLCLQRLFPILRTRSYPDLYQLIRPPNWPLELGSEADSLRMLLDLFS